MNAAAAVVVVVVEGDAATGATAGRVMLQLRHAGVVEQTRRIRAREGAACASTRQVLPKS